MLNNKFFRAKASLNFEFKIFIAWVIKKNTILISKLIQSSNESYKVIKQSVRLQKCFKDDDCRSVGKRNNVLNDLIYLKFFDYN